MQKNILCYGDSNTWGYIPGGKGRYPWDVRWTGIAQKELGSSYRILEDGLNGRTTVFDCPFTGALLNGKEHLECSLIINSPLDLVVLMLGTNDLQQDLDAWFAARGCITLMKKIFNSPLQFAGNKPRVLLMSPILVGENIAAVDGSPIALRGHEQSKRFAALYAEAAGRFGAEFLDAALYAAPSPIDCEHMDDMGHAALGKAVAGKIKAILSEK